MASSRISPSKQQQKIKRKQEQRMASDIGLEPIYNDIQDQDAMHMVQISP